MIYRTGLYTYEALCVLRFVHLVREHSVTCKVESSGKTIEFDKEEEETFGFSKTEFFPESVVQDFNGEILISANYYDNTDELFRKRLEWLFDEQLDDMLDKALVNFGVLKSDKFVVSENKGFIELAYPIGEIVPISIDMIREIKNALLDHAETSMRGQPFDVFKVSQINIIVEELMKDYETLTDMSSSLSSPFFKDSNFAGMKKQFKEIKPKVLEYKKKLQDVGYRYSIAFIRDLFLMKNESD